MSTHTNKIQENKNQSVVNSIPQKQHNGESGFKFVDNRAEAVLQRKIQGMANNSPQVSQLKTFQNMATRHVIQRKQGRENLIPQLQVSFKTLTPKSSDAVIQRAASITLDSSDTIVSVTFNKRASGWRKAVKDSLGPMPSSGMARCHEDPSMGMQIRSVYHFEGMSLADAASELGVAATKAAVEKAIWNAYKDEYHEPDNLHWGAGGQNSSDGAKARALRDALDKDNRGGITYPHKIGDTTYNDRGALEDAAIAVGIDTSDPTKAAAIESSYRSEGCTIL